jgi:hypothetical protein
MISDYLNLVASVISGSHTAHLLHWRATCAGSAGGGVGPAVGIGAGAAVRLRQRGDWRAQVRARMVPVGTM